MSKFLYVPVARDTSDGFLRNPAEGWKDYVARYFNESLGDVGADDKLYIVGHGALAGTSLQTLSAATLFDYLKKEKLPTNHKKFYLFSCYSGVKMPGAGKSFAEAFTFAVRDYYKSATVIGFIGAVQFDRTAGQKSVSTDASFSNYGDTMSDKLRGKNAKVSFSVQRKWIGTNSVAAGAGESSYIAEIRKEEEEVVSSFGNATITRTRVVVLDAAAATRSRPGAMS
ncbi:MAG: hypothetical protein ACREFU_11440 [Acetobacteraceae bacterium]